MQKNVLIVEDDILIREMLSDFFSNIMNFSIVNSSNDGFEGLRDTLNTKYDLICLDNNMPILTGVELLEEIQNEQSQNCNTPVIMISANFPDQKRNMSLNDKTIYLKKPIDLDRLSNYVKILLKNEEIKQ